MLDFVYPQPDSLFDKTFRGCQDRGALSVTIGFDGQTWEDTFIVEGIRCSPNPLVSCDVYRLRLNVSAETQEAVHQALHKMAARPDCSASVIKHTETSTGFVVRGFDWGLTLIVDGVFGEIGDALIDKYYGNKWGGPKIGSTIHIDNFLWDFMDITRPLRLQCIPNGRLPRHSMNFTVT